MYDVGPGNFVTFVAASLSWRKCPGQDSYPLLPVPAYVPALRPSGLFSYDPSPMQCVTAYTASAPNHDSTYSAISVTLIAYVCQSTQSPNPSSVVGAQ